MSYAPSTPASSRMSWFASGSIGSQAAHRLTSRTPWATRLKRWPPLHPTRSPATCSSWHRTSPPPTATIASTAHFAGLGSPTSGCWTSCLKDHQTGGGSTSAAATSAHRERTTTSIGTQSTLHCPPRFTVMQPGTAVSVGRTDYEHHQRQAVANLDADYRQQPTSWVIAIDDSNTNQKRLLIEALWSGSTATMWSTKPATPKAPTSWTSGPGTTSARKSAPSSGKRGNVHWVEATKQIAEEHSGANKEEQAAPPRSHPPHGGPIHRRYPRDHRGAARAYDGSVPPVGREHLEVGHRSELGSTFLLRARLHG